MDKNISFTLKVWRQKGPKDKGHFDTFQMKDIRVIPHYGNDGHLERAAYQ